MNIKFIKLIADCKESTEEISFIPGINFFHGKISSGKSSILRTIDYCLGGNIEKTPAILSELVTAKLLLEIDGTALELRRGIEDENHVEATWSGSKGTGRLRLPITAPGNSKPILNENIYCLSDLLYHFAGVKPVFVPKSKRKTESSVVRLSYRDLQRFCYLDQDELDSNFFDLKTPVVLSKSQNAMKFILGFYTEKISELKHDLSKITSKIAEYRTSLNERKKFLGTLEIGTASQVKRKLKTEREELQKAENTLEGLKKEYKLETHAHDTLRKNAEAKRNQLLNQRHTCNDLKSAIYDQESLKSEFITAKMKHARFIESSSVLSRVSFDKCPICGQNLIKKPSQESCHLCGQKLESGVKDIPEETLLKRDLEDRISELDESIMKRKKSLKQEQNKLEELEKEKNEIDDELDLALSDYDSRYMSSLLNLQHQVTKHDERVKNLHFYEKMVNSIKDMEIETGKLKSAAKDIEKEIKEEEEGIESGFKRKQELENTYIKILNDVKVPGITSSDKIELDINSWIPDILSGGDEKVRWSFYSAGSAGKKTLLKTCFSLALHVVCRNNELHLPSYLIIDTPMKNIGEDANEDIFHSFYSVLYHLASGILSKTQFLIVDKAYIAPDSKLKLKISKRYMTPDDDDALPYISYYRGP